MLTFAKHVGQTSIVLALVLVRLHTQDANDGQYQCVGVGSTGAAAGVETVTVGDSWAKAYTAGLGCYELDGYVALQP